MTTVKIAERLRQLRQERGLSHDRLSKELEKRGVKVSINSLMNYEVTDDQHKKYKSNLGMSANTLLGIAQLYDVSTDYILGRTLTRTADIDTQAMIDKLSLTEESIEYLSHESGVVCFLVNCILKAMKSMRKGKKADIPFVLQSILTRENLWKNDVDIYEVYKKESERLQKMGLVVMLPNESARHHLSEFMRYLQEELFNVLNIGEEVTNGND